MIDKRGKRVLGSGKRGNGARRAATRVALLGMTVFLGACSWFTDFKQQPKIDPWETANDTIAFRGNPQNSVPIYGSAAPGFIYDRTPMPQSITAMASIPNPVPATEGSVNAGRIQYQINCAVCHGALGKGDGVVVKYGFYPPAIGTPQSQAGAGRCRIHRRLHLRHYPQRSRYDAVVQPNRRARPLGHHQLPAVVAG